MAYTIEITGHSHVPREFNDHAAARKWARAMAKKHNRTVSVRHEGRLVETIDPSPIGVGKGKRFPGPGEDWR